MTFISKSRILLGAFTLALCGVAGASPQVDDQGFVRGTPDQLDWKTGEAGVKTALLYGDPSKPGLYVLRNIFPPGIMSTPHYHSEDRVVVVIKGTWYTGTNDRWDASDTKPLGPGSYMIHPKGGVHFDGAKDEEAIVQITGMGPVKTTQIHPEEGHMGHPHLLK